MKVKTKNITIRFYEELNDFLPNENKKKRFKHYFIDRTTVKDLIESLGVPHTEIDLVLVNGKSTDFNYVIDDGDDISVYPVFESFDISNVQHLRPQPLRKPKFICDVHLGKLAKNLRMFGFDVYYKNELIDQEIVKISLSEKRTILTRDIGLLKRREVTHGYFIRDCDPTNQIVEVLKRFDLYKIIKPFSICTDCGNKLVRIPKKEVINLLPRKVEQYQNKFYFCSECKNVFWAGSHLESMKNFIDKVLKLATKSDENAKIIS
jgi:uncharacterized protein with PIN domain/sulfur carrier protein ThiS